MGKLFDILHWLRKWYWRTFNIKTFGVRVIVVSGGKVLLVKHRYGNYWVFPGGGIKKGEKIEDAGVREIFEETRVCIKSFEKVLGTYKNTREGKDDTVTVLVAEQWEKKEEGKWNLEIKESGFFDLVNLPQGTSPATLRRIKEYKLNLNTQFTGGW